MLICCISTKYIFSRAACGWFTVTEHYHQEHSRTENYAIAAVRKGRLPADLIPGIRRKYISSSVHAADTKTAILNRIDTKQRFLPKPQFLFNTPEPEINVTYFYTFNNSVSMLYKSHCIYFTKTSRLMLFRKIIYVYFKNYAKHINTMCGENTKYLYQY